MGAASHSIAATHLFTSMRPMPSYWYATPSSRRPSTSKSALGRYSGFVAAAVEHAKSEQPSLNRASKNCWKSSLHNPYASLTAWFHGDNATTPRTM